MKYKPEWSWDEDTKTAICILKDDKERVFIGEAVCHPNDYDMVSERTGCELAFRRAKLQYYRTVRDADLKPALAALEHVHSCMVHSSKFNPKSYENIMLCKHIQMIKFELSTIKEIIANEYQGISDYIKGKDRIYNSIRKKNSEAKSE